MPATRPTRSSVTPDAAFAASDVQVDATYTTPAEHNNPMEPHATTAVWDGDRLRLYDSNQGGQAVRAMVAKAFSRRPGCGRGDLGACRRRIRLQGTAAAQRDAGRDGGAGRRTTSAAGADAAAAVRAGRLPDADDPADAARCDHPTAYSSSIAHDVVEQTATLKEFAEQSALITRMMYAAPHRRTTHRLAKLDVPVPSWMRAPGECPGSFALESAMDELAVAANVDPVELRIRNEPAGHPEEGTPWSSRMLVQCLRAGADRFGWADRDPRPGAAPARTLAGRHRGRVVDLPGLLLAGDGAGRLRRRRSVTRCRSMRPTSGRARGRR